MDSYPSLPKKTMFKLRTHTGTRKMNFIKFIAFNGNTKELKFSIKGHAKEFVFGDHFFYKITFTFFFDIVLKNIRTSIKIYESERRIVCKEDNGTQKRNHLRCRQILQLRSR